MLPIISNARITTKYLLSFRWILTGATIVVIPSPSAVFQVQFLSSYQNNFMSIASYPAHLFNPTEVDGGDLYVIYTRGGIILY